MPNKNDLFRMRIEPKKKEKVRQLAGKKDMNLSEYTNFLFDREIVREFGFDIDTNE